MTSPRDSVGAKGAFLMASVFVVAAAGLGYELLAGTLSSYLLGNSVLHFSLVIGLFLTAMGIGSFLSRYVEKRLLHVFIAVEIIVGIVGGVAALILFFAFAVLGNYMPVLVAICFAVGALVGLEVPLVVRIVHERTTLKAALGNVLSVDYLGALFVSLLFPLVLVPNLGLVRSGALFGALNVCVALVGLGVFRRELGKSVGLRLGALAALGVLLLVFVSAGRATTLLEDAIYDDEIVYARSTPYQRIVVTRWKEDIRLYLDGNIQFSSVDEFRYHEALVHPVMSLAGRPRRVLVLGGGDGLATREIMKHASVERVDIVDLDPAITRLFTDNEMLAALSGHALSDPRVRVTNEDALTFLEESTGVWDAIVIDLPDPNNESLAKLYSRSFYRLVARRLTPHGAFVTQATGPFYSVDAFWSIFNTVASVELSATGETLNARAYWASVPSFGDWGFVVARQGSIEPGALSIPPGTRYLTGEMLPALFTFPTDIAWRDSPVNSLDAPVLIELYDRGYKAYH